jgi:hypothetical protein
LADLKEEAFLVLCAVHPKVSNIKLQAKQHDH